MRELIKLVVEAKGELFGLLGEILGELQGLRADIAAAQKGPDVSEIRKSLLSQQKRAIEALMDNLPPGSKSVLQGILKGMTMQEED